MHLETCFPLNQETRATMTLFLTAVVVVLPLDLIVQNGVSCKIMKTVAIPMMLLVGLGMQLEMH